LTDGLRPVRMWLGIGRLSSLVPDTITMRAVAGVALMSRFRIPILFLVVCGVMALVHGCARREQAGSATKQVITLWHPWGGTQSQAISRVIEAFEASHPGIDVRPLFTPNNLSNNQKFFTSVAARRPPDVVFVDGPQVAEWAEQGALSPLDKWIEADGISSKDFFAPCWEQNQYQGRVWAMTYCADPNFAFVWNKKDFRDAGLDPDVPPRTIEELDRCVRKLNKWGGRGSARKLVRIGLVPWGQYGPSNSIFTWGWAFGGSFYDPQRRLVTCNDPKVVKALEWMCSYAKDFNMEKIASLQAGFGTAELNPFYVGKLSMCCLHLSGIAEIKKYAPNLEYGMTYIPGPQGGELHSSWVGGWCMAVPKGSRHSKEAWELIRWMCADVEGTTVVGRETGLLPGYRKSPYLEEIRKQPGYAMFLNILEQSRHQRPVMPAQAYYMGALQRAVDAAIYGRESPRQALIDARIETQRELDLVLGPGNQPGGVRR